MDRDEKAERLVDTVLTLAVKKGIPSWPVIPLSDNLGFVWEGSIPTGGDPYLLSIPVVLLLDMDEGVCLERVQLANKQLCRRFRKLAFPGSPLVQVQWFDMRSNSVSMSGDFVLGENARGMSVLGPARQNFSFNGKGDWARDGGYAHEAMAFAAAMSPGMRMMLEASWVARIRFEENGPSVELPTNPEGAYALFKDRASEGGRRKRLLHWVREHCRVTKKKQVKVAEHLRGISSFEWQDSEVRLTPPADSLERAASKKKVAPSVLRAVERYRELVSEYGGGDDKQGTE